MARKDWYLGDATAVGFTIQAPATNGSWGGAAHTLRYFRPMNGQAGRTIGFEQNPLETLDADPPAFSKSGRKISGSFQLPLSYAYQEGLIRLATGDTSVSPGGSGPYTHASTLAQRVLYGTIVYYWEDYKGVKYQELYANVFVTQLTIQQDKEQRPTITVNWVAQTMTESTPAAAPTLVTPEYPDWNDCTLSADGATLIVSSITFDITRAAQEDDHGMASDNAPDVVFLGSNGQRSITLNVEGGLDDDVDDFMQAGDALTGENKMEWNNGASGADNRKITIDLGELLPVISEQPRGTFGRLTSSMQFMCATTAANPISITTTNALDAEEPPTV
mgnify:CR=1 FL=1